MLFVQTKNYRQQTILSQQFKREDNLFLVQAKKTSPINLILQNIIFEIFQQNYSQLKSRQNRKSSELQVVQKVVQLLQGLLKLKISLSCVREIFQLLRISKQKTQQFENYFRNIDEWFLQDLQQGIQHIGTDHTRETMTTKNIGEPQKSSGYGCHTLQLLQYQNQFLSSHLKNSPEKTNKKTSIVPQAPIKQLTISTKQSIVVTNSSIPTSNYLPLQPQLISERSNPQTPSKDNDCIDMRTLRSEIFQSPRFTITAIQELQLNPNNKSIDVKQNKSQMEQLTQLEHVSQQQSPQAQLSHSYSSPSSKSNQLKQFLQFSLPFTQNSLYLESDHKKNESSDFIDLSGRVNPVPSFLHYEESMREMIAKEKKEDLRKSNIIKESLREVEVSSHASTSDKTYNSNIRAIKLNNKLKRGSRESLGRKNQDINVKSQDVKSCLQVIDQKPIVPNLLKTAQKQKNMLFRCTSNEKAQQKQLFRKLQKQRQRQMPKQLQKQLQCKPRFQKQIQQRSRLQKMQRLQRLEKQKLQIQKLQRQKVQKLVIEKNKDKEKDVKKMSACELNKDKKQFLFFKFKR